MKSKTQISMVLAGWLLGTLGVAVLAYKIKPAGASTREDEEFVIPADPVPAEMVPVPAVENKDEAAPPKAEATLGAPVSAKTGADDNIVLATAVSPMEPEPGASASDPSVVPPLPPIPPAVQLPGPSPVGATDKKLEDAIPPAPTGGNPALPPPPPLPSVAPETLPAPRADLLTPIPEPPPGPGQLTVAAFPPPPATSALPPAFVPLTPPPAPPMGLMPTAPSTFCKAPAEAPAAAVPAAPSPAKAAFQAKHLPLTGSHPCKIENQQIVLPDSVREQLGEPGTLLAMPGPDGCLWLSTPASVERMAKQLKRKPNGTAQARAFRRLHFGQSERLAVERGGQVILPERLAQACRVRKDGVFIGVGDHLELWDAERWQRYVEENDPTMKPEEKPRCIGVQTGAINGPF